MISVACLAFARTTTNSKKWNVEARRFVCHVWCVVTYERTQPTTNYCRLLQRRRENKKVLQRWANGDHGKKSRHSRGWGRTCTRPKPTWRGWVMIRIMLRSTKCFAFFFLGGKNYKSDTAAEERHSSDGKTSVCDTHPRERAMCYDSSVSFSSYCWIYMQVIYPVGGLDSDVPVASPTRPFNKKKKTTHKIQT